ncbi:head-tail connector protein [Burkholderia multivorans]|uniref:Bacteriophage protein n=1 Tax=Burkholderia multivorans (strain ATCC 17616 / 249) TaxID=395019 RepID=A0A0H3KN67_BURM1|nr:head-tail connector protein [Burkholderia multivorans]YP_355410.1 head-tail adaptor Ad1 [Burkholderia phage Bcep176]ABA60076.1 gp74 [Burkholderia phage Bcep176]ABX17552.1 gp7 [Burkholderia multivorans ATCC 17616]MBU9420062.1 head-tail connector protein [Burkholderia multivorans]MBU9501324.1 head-tail connector protein [Burkholderia multivorans]MCO1358829.1 head-tail connector protein [Burkholderia multivorans]
MALVELKLALGFVRANAGVEDDVVQMLLDAATQSAVDYLNRQVFETEDAMTTAIEAGTAGQNPMVVNAAIRAAILKITAELYANREDTAFGPITELPLNARALLRPHRIIPGV